MIKKFYYKNSIVFRICHNIFKLLLYKIKVFVSIGLLVCLIPTLTGCNSSSDKAVEDVKETILPVTTSNDCVFLDDIKTPLYGDVYAIVNTKGKSFSVSWGELNYTDGYCPNSSGYFGFDFPILVIANKISSKACVGDEVAVSTNYGQYYYKITDVPNTVLNDFGDNLINTDTEKPILNFARAGEKLAIQFKNKTVEASKLYGTKILTKGVSK